MRKRVILTGGLMTGDWWSSRRSRVTMYDINGWVADLSELNTGRWNHGCGYYYNDENELFYLVTGGAVDFQAKESISSTEIISESEASKGSKGQWSFVGNLPGGRTYMRGITINNDVFMSGGIVEDGTYSKDVLKYDQKTKIWETIGSMSVEGFAHSLSLVPLSEIEPYCIS